MSLSAHPEFGWSWSRHRLYEQCPRKYYLKAYLAWQGWGAEPDTPSYTAYRLSKLTSFPQLVGTLVHDALRTVADAAKNDDPLPEYEALWQEAWPKIVSVRNTDRGTFMRDPKRSPMLTDLYYATKTPQEISDEMHAARDTLSRCLANALELPLWDDVRTAARVRAPDQLSSISVQVLGDPFPIIWWGAPDLAYVPGSRATVDILDYKTGEHIGIEEATQQLHCYAAFLIAGGARWDERWRGRIVDLRDARETVVPITLQGVNEAFTIVEADVRRWRLCQTSAEPNLAEMKSFPLAEDRRICPWCQYVGLCQELEPRPPAH